ncbi:MAG: DMT family transporter [Burkholderiaceae bacterium]
MSQVAIPRRALILLVVLTLVWGTNWPLFPLAVQEVSVWTFRSVSVFIAGAALLLVARMRGESLRIEPRYWRVVILSSLFYLVIWNIATAWSATLIATGQSAVLGFTMPLWAALITWGVLGERPTRRLMLAIVLGAAAVLLLMVPGLRDYAEAPLGFALGLLGGLGWAVGTLILKRGNVNAGALVLTGWQLMLCWIPITIAALVLAEGEWFVPSWQSIVVIAYIALIPMSIGNASWFSIVGLLPANVAGLASIMVPIVAMISGAIVHGEPLGLLQWLAMACSAGALALAVLKPSS